MFWSGPEDAVISLSLSWDRSHIFPWDSVVQLHIPYPIYRQKEVHLPLLFSGSVGSQIIVCAFPIMINKMIMIFNDDSDDSDDSDDGVSTIMMLVN